MSDTIYKLLGGELSFTAEQLEYYDIREQFHELALASRDKALEEFYHRFKDFDSMVKGTHFWIKEYMVQGSTLAAKILAGHEHYDLDPERFVSEYFDTNRLMSAANRMKEFVKSQEDEHNQNEQERAERTDAAGSAWMGGGFGLKGALKGAAEAEALNLAGAAISGAFNMIGRSMEDSRHKEEQEAFFRDKRTPKAFSDGIYSGLADMYLDLLKYIRKNCPEINLVVPKREDLDKSKSLLSNIQKGIIPTEKINENCLRVLAMNPLYQDAYTFAVKHSPDDFGTLLDMDHRFHVGIMESQLDTVMNAYFKTLDVSTEDNALNARTLMAQKAADLNIRNYTGYEKLEKLIQKYDCQYRTVGDTQFATREEADLQRIVLETFNMQKLDGKYSEVARSIEEVHVKAKELGVSDEWLSMRFESALNETQHRAAQELDEFYKTLDLSTEDLALAARAIIEHKAEKLELKNYSTYAPLEQLLTDFDVKARTVATKLFESREIASKHRKAYNWYRESGFIDAEEKALKLKVQLENYSKETGNDFSWLLKDVLIALQHYEDVACIQFGYRYANREEALSALSDESLFYQAVYSAIFQYVRQNSIKSLQCLDSKIVNTAKQVLNISPDIEMYVYLSTELIPSGNSGFALCSDGIHWSNGSALLSKVADNKLVKMFFSRKAEEMQNKYRVKSFFISWKELFEAPDVPAVQGNKLELISNMQFEADHIDAIALCKVLGQLQTMAKTSHVHFTADAHTMDSSKLQGVAQITSLPNLQ